MDFKSKAIAEFYLKNKTHPQAEHVVDFLNDVYPYKKQFNFSFDQAVVKADNWMKRMSKKNKNSKAGKVKFIKDLGNGYKLVRLLDQESKNWESLHMGHCVSSYSKHKGIYSIRDFKDYPHCTIEKNFTGIAQIKGKSNGIVIEKYREYCVKALEYLNSRVNERDMRNLGFVAVNHRFIKEYFTGLTSFYKIRGQCFVGNRFELTQKKSFKEKSWFHKLFTKLYNIKLEQCLNLLLDNGKCSEAVAELLGLGVAIDGRPDSYSHQSKLELAGRNAVLRADYKMLQSILPYVIKTSAITYFGQDAMGKDDLQALELLRLYVKNNESILKGYSYERDSYSEVMSEWAYRAIHFRKAKILNYIMDHADVKIRYDIRDIVHNFYDKESTEILEVLILRGKVSQDKLLSMALYSVENRSFDCLNLVLNYLSFNEEIGQSLLIKAVNSYLNNENKEKIVKILLSKGAKNNEAFLFACAGFMDGVCNAFMSHSEIPELKGKVLNETLTVAKVAEILIDNKVNVFAYRNLAYRMAYSCQNKEMMALLSRRTKMLPRRYNPAMRRIKASISGFYSKNIRFID